MKRKLKKNSPVEEARINAAIASDPDTFEATDEQFAKAIRGRPPLPESARKQRVTIMLDPEVVAHFKAKGRGWQTRANAVLVEHVRREKGKDW